MKKIGIIGLGSLGTAMAEKLLEKGYAISLFDPSLQNENELQLKGIKIANSPAQATQASDLIFSSLQEQYLYKETGMMSALHPQLTVVACAVLSLYEIQHLAAIFKQENVNFLDAPPVGTPAQAADGNLIFFVGGNQYIVQTHMDVFLGLGRKIIHMGEIGSGCIAKLTHQVMVGLQQVAYAENTYIAEKIGMDIEHFLTLMEVKKEKSNYYHYPPSTLQELLEDFYLAVKMRERILIPPPLWGAAQALFKNQN